MAWVECCYAWVATKRRGKKLYRYCYYRRDTRLIHIRGENGKPLLPTDEGFIAAYRKIHVSFNRPATERAISGTFGEVIIAYLQSPEFKALAPETQNNYRLHLDDLRERIGKFQVASVTRASIKKRRDSLAEKTPGKAHRFTAVCRLLFEWAKTEDRWKLTDNPATAIRKLKTGDGWRRWTNEEIQKFLDGANPGMKLALLLALCTGLRRGDAIRLRKNAYQNGLIEVVTASAEFHYGCPPIVI